MYDQRPVGFGGAQDLPSQFQNDLTADDLLHLAHVSTLSTEFGHTEFDPFLAMLRGPFEALWMGRVDSPGRH